MSAIDTTRLTDEQARREGAIAGLAALRELEQAAETIDHEHDTAAEYCGKQLGDAMTFAAKFGPMPPKIEGVIVAMAELIHFYTTTGVPDLDNWVPVSSMTQAELTLEIQSMEADQAAIAEELSRPNQQQPSEATPKAEPSAYDKEFDALADKFAEEIRKLRAKHRDSVGATA